MKKITCFIMIFVCIAFTATSEQTVYPDLSRYSIEELEYLDNMIKNEILFRNGCEYWFDYGFGQYVPKIQLSSGDEPELGITIINENNRMILSIENIKEKSDYEKYINLIMANGYNEVYSRTTTNIVLRDGKGHSIELKNYSLIGKIVVYALAYNVK